MKTVFVVGAGPAGMFAARKIAMAGHQVIIFNRDIKPGGLAEYGIYPSKDKMRSGLRKQFAAVLAMPNVHYFGHVPIGTNRALTIQELQNFKPAAIVFAVGAQGTKKVGLPGEDSKGVYSAKDFVYHYNRLPPFATRDFSTGRRIAIVGIGNVMVDIARWLMIDDPRHTTEEVIVIARRGPFEAKFDKKEFAHIEQHLDRTDFQQELERIKDKLAAVGQDVSKLANDTFPVLSKPVNRTAGPRLLFRFLSSPKEIQAGPDGRIRSLTVTENTLVQEDGSVASKATDETVEIDVDTVIFAIGDVHDAMLGIPTSATGYVTSDSTDPKQTSYAVFDPKKGQILDGICVVGWARRPSEGLVGIARHDAELGAEHVLEYLKRVPETDSRSPEQIGQYLEDKNVQVVKKPDLGYLGKVEEEEAKKQGLTFFKFNDDAAMLAAIQREKARARSERSFIGSDTVPIRCLRPSIQVQCALPSEAAAISTFVDNLIRLLTQSGYIPVSIDNIEIALREALNNAVVHGNRGDQGRHVCVRCRYESGDISILVSDEGEGFDLSKLPDPTAPGGIYSTHGRGIYLMNAFMDEVRFEHGGSVVRMRKRVAVSMANSACPNVRTAPA